MAPKASEASDAALAFVLGGGDLMEATKRWPAVKYSSLHKRVARAKKRALADESEQAASASRSLASRKKRRKSYNRTSKQVERDWAAEAKQRAEHTARLKAAVKEGVRLYNAGLGRAKAARKVSASFDVTVSSYMLRQYADGSSPAKRGRPADSKKTVVLDAVASYSRVEQTSKLLSKPKALGGLAVDLLESSAAAASASFSSSAAASGTSSNATESKRRRRKAKRMAREIRKGHPELSTHKLGASVVEEARLNWLRESRLREWTARNRGRQGARVQLCLAFRELHDTATRARCFREVRHLACDYGGRRAQGGDFGHVVGCNVKGGRGV